MMTRNRREFLADVGKGMLVASVGSALAADLGLAPVFAGDAPDRLTFGNFEPLASLMQDTPADKLLPILVDKIKSGTELKSLVAACALANARSFGGHDYDGYHSFMALCPSFQMSQEMPDDRKALPVLKVLHRNARFMQKVGGGKHDAMHPIEAGEVAHGHGGQELRESMRKPDQSQAEKKLAAITRDSINEAYNDLQFCVQDDVDVHRVVLAWRSWATLDLTGKEQATTLLRQSVRYCTDSERYNVEHKRSPGIRATLPKLLDQHQLVGKKVGDRKGDDAWVEQLCQAIYAGNRDQAAEAVAQALAEGFAPEQIGEAISLAANRLVLRDPGRAKNQVQDGKPLGSIHGASVGVHASDSANAWRNIARVSNHRNLVASLIVAGYHTAGQAGMAGQNPYPWPEHLESVKVTGEKELLGEAESAIKARDQIRVCAVIHKYGERGYSPRPMFDLMLRFACSEDGALHAEKYYRTVSEEFASTRPSMKWRHLVGLGRVTASEFGFPAPGYADACRLLKV